MLDTAMNAHLSTALLRPAPLAACQSPVGSSAVLSAAAPVVTVAEAARADEAPKDFESAFNRAPITRQFNNGDTIRSFEGRNASTSIAQYRGYGIWTGTTALREAGGAARDPFAGNRQRADGKGLDDYSSFDFAVKNVGGGNDTGEQAMLFRSTPSARVLAADGCVVSMPSTTLTITAGLILTLSMRAAFDGRAMSPRPAGMGCDSP
jgi:hypothetical protein